MDDPAATAPRAPLVARLVDEATLAGVPFYRLRVTAADGAEESFETGIDGRFETATAFAAGELVLDLLEQTGSGDLIQTRRDAAAQVPRRVVVEHLPGAPQADIRIPVGPTFHLRLEPAGLRPPEEFRATLLAAVRRQAFDKAHTTVRNGAPLWARFAPTASLLGGGPPWKLMVRSRDGVLYGEAPVDAIDGPHPDVLVIPLAAGACVRGRLLDPDGQPVPRTFVQLWREGASFDQPDNYPSLVVTAEDGSFAHEALKPGAYAVKVEEDGFEPFADALDLEPGQVLEGYDLVLARAPRAGAIRGVVTSRSGEHHGAVQATLVAHTEPPSATTAPVEWEEEDGRWQGRFAFEDLAVGDYAVGLMLQEYYAISPGAAEVAAPADGLVFTIEDLDPSAELTVTATDAATGEPLTDFRINFSWTPDARRGDGRGARAKEGAVHIRGFPADLPFSYRVTTESGHAPTWGEVPQGYAPGAQALAVALTPGWGTEVIAVDGEDRPLEGVRVLFDDQEAGRTDADGRLRVQLPEKPQKVAAEYRDWTPTPSSYDRTTGAFRDFLPFLRLVFTPPGEDGAPQRD